MKRLLSAILGGTAWLASHAASADETPIKDPAEGWDRLWNEVLVDLWIIGIIFGIAAAYMLWKYRAKSPEDRGGGPRLSMAQAWSWAMIPAFVFMADDFYLAAKGWTLWNIQRTVPENAMEVKVTGMRWSWEFEYPNGLTTEVLKVPAGRPIVLRMTSDDVIHSFSLPKYRVKEDLMPGRVTYLWFYPKEPTKTLVTCVEYCGLAHANMQADVIAVPEAEFNAWLAKEKAAQDADA